MEQTLRALVHIITLFCCLIENTQGQSVNQNASSVTLKEEENATLPCYYDASATTVYVFWYIQTGSRTPHPIYSELLGDSNFPSKLQNRLSASHDKTGKSFHLIISSVNLSDSSVYFCALQNTQSGYRLIFGKGTKLNVVPKEESKTAAFVLGSDEDNKEDKARACLITDFSSHNISVTLNGANIYGVPSVIEGDKQYSVVAFLPESKERSNFNCNVVVNGNTTKGDNNDIENVCESDMAYVFESDEKLNSLSLMVLGLRVIFLKSIAFNVLMTVRAWMS